MDTELPPADELAAVFASMSGLLLSTETVSSALELITTLVAETVSDVDGAGVTLLDEHSERTTAASTDPSSPTRTACSTNSARAVPRGVGPAGHGARR